MIECIIRSLHRVKSTPNNKHFLRHLSKRAVVPSTVDSATMDLPTVVAKLNMLAPTPLAEEWDNVGLLVEPSAPHLVRSMMLTNDLTEAVCDEAVMKKVDFILSYHPPLFKSIKRVTCSNWKERNIVKCLENRMAVYSPHTSFDAVEGGVNDWLAQAFDPAKVDPITQSYAARHVLCHSHRVEVCVPKCMLEQVAVRNMVDHLLNLPSTYNGDENPLMVRTIQRKEEFVVMMRCQETVLVDIMEILKKSPDILPFTSVSKLEKLPLPRHGMGRKLVLREPFSLLELVDRLKKHLGIKHVQVALGSGKTMAEPINIVALCAGSGASVLHDVIADVYVTGEMSHHEVLDVVAGSKSVVLTGHSNSERGYLTALMPRLIQLLDNKVSVFTSDHDEDPLRIV